MVGTPAQQSLVKKFFDPFFNWDDDGKLREWLRGQDPDELEQFLNWFNFSSRRDREILGRQELAKLRDRQRPAPEVLTLKPTYLGVGVDLKECWRRLRTWWMQAK